MSCCGTTPGNSTGVITIHYIFYAGCRNVLLPMYIHYIHGQKKSFLFRLKKRDNSDICKGDTGQNKYE
jgi:hypothetical protein